MYTVTVPDDRGWKYTQFRYPAGEMQVRFLPEQRDVLLGLIDARVRVVANIRTGDDQMELALLTDAIRGLVGWMELELVLPYLPYGRADRRFTDADCFGLKVFGSFIDSLGYCKVITLDAHSIRAKHQIANLTDHSPRNLIGEAIKKVCTPYKDIAIVLPDAGAMRYKLTTHYKCTKQRNKETGEILGFSVPNMESLSHQKVILIVDDICDGGATFLRLADMLPNLPKYLYVTHGIFSKGTEELSKRFKWIYTSNSFKEFHPFVTRLEWKL